MKKIVLILCLMSIILIGIALVSGVMVAGGRIDLSTHLLLVMMAGCLAIISNATAIVYIFYIFKVGKTNSSLRSV